MSNLSSSADELAKKAPFLNYFLDPIKNHYIDFEGTASRQQFWMYALVQAILFMVLFIVAVILMVVVGLISTDLAAIVSLVLYGIIGLAYLAVILPGLSIAVRRIRDTGYTPWLILICLVPFIGFIGVLVLLCLPTKAASSEQ